MHVEVPVKVNAVVDEKIAVLVSALNRIEGVITLDSCQCGLDGMAYVYLTSAEEGGEVALAERIARMLRGAAQRR